MSVLLLSTVPAAGIAAALGVTTPREAARIALRTVVCEQLDPDHGPPGGSHGDLLLPKSMTLPHGVVVRAPAFENRARLWMAQEPGEDDTLVVDFVPAPNSGQLILVRHADRDPGETRLNATGEARARALPDALADLPLDAIFMTDFRRNADTAAPLAEARGLVPQVRAPDQALAAALAQAAAGGSAIWIGNVGNLSHLWDAYRLPGAPPVEYGDIAVLTAEGGIWRVTRRAVAP